MISAVTEEEHSSVTVDTEEDSDSDASLFTSPSSIMDIEDIVSSLMDPDCDNNILVSSDFGITSGSATASSSTFTCGLTSSVGEIGGVAYAVLRVFLMYVQRFNTRWKRNFERAKQISPQHL